jgi:hypothetical protein
MITTILDHSSYYKSCRDQGNRSTCLAFAVSDIHSYHHNVYDELSVDYLCHHAAKNTPGWAGEGFGLDVMFSAVSYEGQPLEHLYPYSPNNPLAPLVIPPIGITPLYKAKVTNETNCFDEIVTLIDAGNTVGLVMAVTPSLYRPVNGVVNYDVNALVDNYHAMIATGHGVNGSSAEKFLKVRNSWGDGWGMSGYAWLPKSLIDLHLIGTFRI